MFHSMLNNRLFKISRQEKPPFYVAQCSSEPLSSTIQTICVSASVAEGATPAAVEAILIELARVRLHGFSLREVGRLEWLWNPAVFARQMDRVLKRLWL
jgi:hypothetical protein